jgi:predicted small lipoprotein YifL
MVPIIKRGGGLIDFSVQGWARFVAVGVVVAAVCLSASACGRKGPLDPPPGAAQYSQPAPASREQLASPDGQVGVDRDGKALAPPPSKQRQPFILDGLVE